MKWDRKVCHKQTLSKNETGADRNQSWKQDSRSSDLLSGAYNFNNSLILSHKMNSQNKMFAFYMC